MKPEITNDVACQLCLYHAYAPALYGLLLKLAPDASTADGILEKSFAKIQEELGNYDVQKGTIFSFMLRITLSQCEAALHLPVRAVMM